MLKRWSGDRYWQTVEGAIELAHQVEVADMPGEDVTKRDGKGEEVQENVYVQKQFGRG